MTRFLTTTALALTLATGAAYAQSNDNAEQAEQNLENAGESMEQAGENAADATENAAEDAAQATENAAEDAEEATENAADDATAAAGDMMDNDSNMIRARDILGGTIYSSNAADGDAEFQTTDYDTVGDDWEQIGSIEDIVLSSDGELRGVVAEVGGFLDIGDKHIFVEMDNVRLVPSDDAEIALVVGYSEEQLEEMEGIDEAFWQ